MDVLTAIVGVLGTGMLAVIGYIAHSVDACKESLWKMEARIVHLEMMRDAEHKSWSSRRDRRPGER